MDCSPNNVEETGIKMNTSNAQQILIDRINELCTQRGISYYNLSYKSTIPMTTLLHIMDGTTKNPGVFTLLKLCDGLGISLIEFFDTEEFRELMTE